MVSHIDGFGDAERCAHAENDASPWAATRKRLPDYRKYRKFQVVARSAREVATRVPYAMR